MVDMAVLRENVCGISLCERRQAFNCVQRLKVTRHRLQRIRHPMGADVVGDNEFVLALRMRLHHRGVTAVGE